MPESKRFAALTGLLLDFVRCKPVLGRMVGGIVQPQDIEDILQETYIRVCAASEKTEINNPKSFMLKTARNLAINHVSTAYQKRIQLEDFSSSDVDPISLSLESQFESRERFLGFCRAVRELPPQCRKAFILRKVYGLSQQEIAAYLEISESTVEKHVAKGLLLCRESMLEMGHIEARAKNDGNADAKKRRRQ